MQTKNTPCIKVVITKFSDGIRVLTFFFILFLSVVTAVAQTDLPLGSWRAHISYNSIHHIAISNTLVYAAANGGVMVLDRSENNLTTFSKINGLTSSEISCLNFNDAIQQLMVGHTDGSLTILKGKNITAFTRLRDISVSTSKSINHISFRQNLAYLSTDYGIVVFDMTVNEIKETWRDLGDSGQQIIIRESTHLGDSIFLATEKGVLAGNLNDNLLDFSQWKRYDENEFNTTIQHVAVFNNSIFASINNDGLYKNGTGTWTKESFLQNISFQSLQSSANHLVIVSGNQVWKLSSSGELTSVSSPLITSPQFAIEDNNTTLWIGDSANGLISNTNGQFVNYLSNGPTFSQATRLKFYEKNLYAVRGGYSTSLQPMGNEADINSFYLGQWSSVTAPVLDATDIAFSGETFYISSFGFGVQSGSISNPDIIYNESNSTLVNIGPGMNTVNVTSIESSSLGLWVANYGANSPLHLLNQGNWEGFSFPFAPARFPVELLFDFYGSVWAIISPSQGGGLLVFNKDRNQSVFLTNDAGAGGLPDRRVTCIVNDRDGYVWIGMEKGIAYFFNPPAVFGTTVNAVRPIFENRFLLGEEKITAIAVDGGNRKWIGTERGAWLFNPTGEELIYNFTEENSPLLSNVIRAIEVDPISGEVFFATAKGICSFRSDATAGKPSFQSVKIFPNPVTAGFNGTVGISGLSTDAIVKITDVSGKLILETRANGGTATWNMRDYSGHRATTGMYLIFSATQDGRENFVGKIAVVD